MLASERRVLRAKLGGGVRRERPEWSRRRSGDAMEVARRGAGDPADLIEVPEVGIEPTLPEGNGILSPARLPVSPLRPGRILLILHGCPRRAGVVSRRPT